MKKRIGVLFAIAAALFAAAPAGATVIGKPAKACAFLADHALPGHFNRKSANMARELAGFKGGMFVVPMSAIERTGHIPGVPLLSSIPPGDGSDGCVAVASSLMDTSKTRQGREWLWMVGIASTRHPGAYKDAVMAANHPALRSIAGDLGLGAGHTKKVVLASECQASRWLRSAGSAEQEFGLVQGDLRPGREYLPSSGRQEAEIRNCS